MKKSHQNIDTNNTIIYIFIIMLLITPITAFAQDYNVQINAVESSFKEKNIDNLKPHLRAHFQFENVPMRMTFGIMNNIMQRYPALKDIKIIETKENTALVEYDFEQMGTQQSYISFDKNDKIIMIDLFDEVVKKFMASNTPEQPGVQAPSPSELEFEYSVEKIQFPSKDGLLITGNLYEIDKSKPIILLCHQAGYNKFEYADIAPRLNQMGYNCLAIDQRSGNTFAEQINETNERAKENGMRALGYLDAEQDIVAVIEYLKKRYRKKVILWGSSYSSALALHIAAKNKKVKAVLSFSPGDYFEDLKPPLEKVIPTLKKAYFITSSKEESNNVILSLLVNAKLKKSQTHFTPISAGHHGSRALWLNQDGADEYWNAVKRFLDNI